MSGKKIIDGLQDAVAFAEGDQSRGTLTRLELVAIAEESVADRERLEAINADLLAALQAAYEDFERISRNSHERWDGERFIWNDDVWREADSDDFALAQLMRGAIARAQGKG